MSVLFVGGGGGKMYNESLGPAFTIYVVLVVVDGGEWDTNLWHAN